MKEIILVKDGELALKGLNRSTFEDILVKNMRRRLSPLGKFAFTKSQSTVMIEPLEEGIDLDEAAGRLTRVFGIAGFSRAAQAPKEMGEILRIAGEYLAPQLMEAASFKVEAKRSDKKFPLKSPQISAELGGYLGVDCVRTRDGLVYAAAYNGAAMKKRQSDLVRTDGGHTAAILSVEGELTGFAFDADGDLWLTVVTSSGGALCRARHDSWGTSVEQVVTQIDGAPLGVLSAVETGPDGKVYFAVSTEAAAKNGLESALRTELIAHTGTGCVYVYDPSARTVEQVLGGVAGAAGLALSEDGRTLYVSDLGDRCIWSVDADARELTAGGKNCGSFVSGLPGYPGALALDEDGTLYISYRWTRSGWLEKHTDSTLLRGIALRAGENIQKKLFKLPADAPCAEAVDTADGSWKQTFSGGELDGCTAVCPAGSKVYFGAAGSASLLSARV